MLVAAASPSRSLGGGLVEIRVHGWVVVHLHLAEDPQWPPSGIDFGEQPVGRLDQVLPLERMGELSVSNLLAGI